MLSAPNQGPLQSYGRLLALAWDQRWTFLGAVVFSAILAATQGGYAWLIGPVLRFVYDAEAAERFRGVIPVSLRPLLADPTGVSWLLAAAIVGIAFVRGFSQFAATYLMSRTGHQIVRKIRATLYSHLLYLPVAFFRQQARGDLVARLTSDTLQLQGTVTSSLSSLAQQVLQILVLATLAVSLDPLLGLLALSALPILAFVLQRVSRKVRGRQAQAWQTQGELASAVERTAAAAPIIKAYTSEPALERRFRRLDSDFFRFLLEAVRVRALMAPVSELLGAAALAATLWYANTRVSAGHLQPEDFVSFFAAVFLLYRPVKAAAVTHSEIMNGLAALDRLDQVVREPREAPDPPACVELSSLKERVEIHGLRFRYPNASEEVLAGVDLNLNRGETVALVGASGAGKSTLVSLLLRLEDPTGGRITVDGTDITHATRRSLRRLCALVTQEPMLLRDSVRGNIACAEEVTDDERLAQAVHAAGLERLVGALPNGVDTDVGEAGARFSGGERQRICLARAFYRDAPLLLLDEATSSLDSEAERDLRDAFERLAKGRTVLLVAHRLSSVRSANRIAVLDQGRIVEEGTHDVLWAQNGVYRRLFSSQAGDPEGASATAGVC